ncbi:MAG: hypothetical protein ACLT2T_14785 [Bilophila wadsworthia]
MGHPEADRTLAMGSACETIEEVVNLLNACGQRRPVKVRLFRPFSTEHLLQVIPSTVKTITVLDRTKEPGCLAAVPRRLRRLHGKGQDAGNPRRPLRSGFQGIHARHG